MAQISVTLKFFSFFFFWVKNWSRFWCCGLGSGLGSQWLRWWVIFAVNSSNTLNYKRYNTDNNDNKAYQYYYKTSHTYLVVVSF